jgi:hypothetical protein
VEKTFFSDALTGVLLPFQQTLPPPSLFQSLNRSTLALAEDLRLPLPKCPLVLDAAVARVMNKCRTRLHKGDSKWDMSDILMEQVGPQKGGCGLQERMHMLYVNILERSLSLGIQEYLCVSAWSRLLLGDIFSVVF